jgi:hypothetical protein
MIHDILLPLFGVPNQNETPTAQFVPSIINAQKVDLPGR